MATPVRLHRVAADLPRLSRETNGLDYVNVSRPSEWSSPFRVGAVCTHPVTKRRVVVADNTHALQLFRLHVAQLLQNDPARRKAFADLRGKNLACPCRPDSPCYGDVLLELVNEPSDRG